MAIKQHAQAELINVRKNLNEESREGWKGQRQIYRGNSKLSIWQVRAII